jgi:hypothetical protein
MNDARIILKDRLIEIGISPKNATVIALDAGSSQVYVDKDYFIELRLSKNLLNKALTIVNKFYSGQLSE